MSNFFIHPEGVPEKSFLELFELLKKTGQNEIALTKNNFVTHLIGKKKNGINKDVIYVVFLDESRHTQEIPDSLLFLSPNDFSTCIEAADIKSQDIAAPILSIARSGMSFIDKEAKNNAIKILDILCNTKNEKTQSFFEAQSLGFDPFLLGKAPVDNTIRFHERFGRLPINLRESKWGDKDFNFENINFNPHGEEKIFYVFREKILTVPHGIVKLPGEYEVVVPDRLDIGDIKFRSIVFKNGKNVSKQSTNYGFNFFWELPIKNASEYLSVLERFSDKGYVGTLAGDFIAGIHFAENRILTFKELNLLTDLAIKYNIVNIKEDPQNSGLFLIDSNKKKLCYQKGNLSFILATGRFPRPSESIRFKTPQPPEHRSLKDDKLKKTSSDMEREL